MSPNLMLLLGGALVFVAVFLVLATVTAAAGERTAAARSLTIVRSLGTDLAPGESETERPFAERVLAPLSDRLVSLGRRLTRADTAERLRHRLDIAGNPPGWDVSRLIGAKALSMVVLGGLAVVYVLANGTAVPKAALVIVAVGGFGFVLPNLLLYNAGQKRETLMQRALPDALDLLTVSVEAGLGFDAAVMKVAKNTRGPLAEEFARLLQEMQLGVGRGEALRGLAERSTLKDLKTFSLAIVQADQLGVPIGRVLRVQSTEMRLKRRQRAEEQAQKVPVKIMIPLVLFIMPCLLIVVGGPAASQMMNIF
ncbi:MAG: type II secretion system F family protein [Actinomycetota bacterium]|nr:type II secretion system F family protein [Actinomycetota bacterium]